MRKLKNKILVAVFLLLTVFIANGNSVLAMDKKYSINNDNLISIGNDIDYEFRELQNLIDNKLNMIENSENKYIYQYNYNDIKNIVNNSNFNFQEFNLKYGTNYTKESFLSKVIYEINNTEIEKNPQTNFSPMASGICNVNKSSKGWNYYREFTDRWVTDYAINDLRDYASLLKGGGTGISLTRFLTGGFGGVFTFAFSIGMKYQGWYFETLARSMDIKNNGCGVVTDINKFTTVFTVWDQKDF